MKLQIANIARDVEPAGDGCFNLYDVGFDTVQFRRFPEALNATLMLRVTFEPFELGMEHEVLIKVLDEGGRLVGDAIGYTARPALGSAGAHMPAHCTQVHSFKRGVPGIIAPTVIERPGVYRIEVELDGELAHAFDILCVYEGSARQGGSPRRDWASR